MTTNSHLDADAVLRRYLLGSLSPELLDGIERRLFSDDQIFWEHLSLVEEQLIDDCAWGRLGVEETERFDRNFLTTKERHAKLEFARALRAYIEGRKVESTRFAAWLRGPVRAPGWAVAAAAVLLLAVLPALTLRLYSPPASPKIATARLTPGQIRDIGQELVRVELDPTCQTVELRLEAVPQEYRTYSATLFEVTGDEVELWSQHRLTAVAGDVRSAVRLTLPCALLPEGDYYVRLHGVSPGVAPVPLGRYSFRVLRP